MTTNCPPVEIACGNRRSHQYRSLLAAIARVFLLLIAITAIQSLTADAAAPAVLAEDVEVRDDDGPFADVFRSHYAGLRSYFERALGNHAEAEEAAQETLLRLHARHRRAPLPADDVKHWLYAVARNHAIYVRRRRQRTEQLISPQDIIEQIDHSQWADVTPTMMRHDFDGLRHLIERLPRRQQLLLGLRYRLNFTTAETADALEMTCDNVRQTERRALSFLRARL